MRGRTGFRRNKQTSISHAGSLRPRYWRPLRTNHHSICSIFAFGPRFPGGERVLSWSATQNRSPRCGSERFIPTPTSAYVSSRVNTVDLAVDYATRAVQTVTADFHACGLKLEVFSLFNTTRNIRHRPRIAERNEIDHSTKPCRSFPGNEWGWNEESFPS